MCMIEGLRGLEFASGDSRERAASVGGRPGVPRPVLPRGTPATVGFEERVIMVPCPLLPGEALARLGLKERGSNCAGGARGTVLVWLRIGIGNSKRGGWRDGWLFSIKKALRCGKSGSFFCTASWEKASPGGPGGAVPKVEREGGILDTTSAVGTSSWPRGKMPGPPRGTSGANAASKAKLRMLTADLLRVSSCGGPMGQGPRMGTRKAGAARASVPYPT